MKIKSLGFGVVLGLSIGVTITAVAQQVYEAYTNSFPVYVNGEQKDIEGYNINGSTYFKLRDLGSFIGFEVDFKEDNILIETQNSKTTNNTIKNLEPEDVQVIDDHTINKNGKSYILLDHIQRSILKNTYISVDEETSEPYIYDCATNEKLSEPIPYIIFAERWFVSEDDFQNLILPLDKE